MAINRRVQKDGTVRWQVVVDQHDHATGKRRRHTVGTFRNKKIANTEERKALDAIEQRKYISRSDMTVAELIQTWLTNKKLLVSPQTYFNYEYGSARHVVPHIGSALVQQVEALHIQQWLDALDVGDRTRQEAFGIVRQSFKFAVRMGIVSTSPCEQVQVRRAVAKSRTIWTDQQLRDFLSVAELDTYGGLWHLLCHTGMRFSEAAGLRWSDVSWEGKSVRVRQSVIQDRGNNSAPAIQSSLKNKSSRRTITVSQATIDYLRTCKAVQNEARLSAEEWEDNDLISCYHHGKPLQNSGMRRKLLTICKAADVPVVTPHALRHLHATNLARAGVPIRVAMERLGQSTPEVLINIYQHVDQEMREDVVTKLDKLLS